MKQQRRLGFTLVEMLVVIAIIGALASMILPAVQAARETGRRAVCGSRMRECGKAIAAHVGKDNNGRYPGYTNRVGGQARSWPVAILPNLEQKSVYNSWRDTAGVGPTPYLETFICPSDPSKGSANNAAAPPISFVLNNGAWATNAAADGVGHDYFTTGVATYKRDFVDGESYTLLLSENVQAGSWVTADKLANGFVWHNTTSPNANQRINGNKRTATLGQDTARPSSWHPGGVNAVFCDGHDRFINQHIGYFVYQQLMTTDSAQSSAPSAAKNYVLSERDY